MQVAKRMVNVPSRNPSSRYPRTKLQCQIVRVCPKDQCWETEEKSELSSLPNVEHVEGYRDEK